MSPEQITRRNRMTGYDVRAKMAVIEGWAAEWGCTPDQLPLRIREVLAIRPLLGLIKSNDKDD